MRRIITSVLSRVPSTALQSGTGFSHERDRNCMCGFCPYPSKGSGLGIPRTRTKGIYWGDCSTVSTGIFRILATALVRVLPLRLDCLYGIDFFFGGGTFRA